MVVIAAGIAALIYEIRMYLWSSASIRLDIILISLALGLLYGSAVVLLFSRRWHKAAALLTAVLVLIGGGMSYKWFEVSREGQRVSEAFEEGNRLLFKAKFRDRETYESHFGPFTGASVDYPTGHWQIEGQSRFTRVIINAKGRVWLFYQCYEDIECHSGPGGSGLRKSNDDPRQWSASLKPRIGIPFDIEITHTETNALSVKERDQTIHFTKAPPPVDPGPAPQSLRFLGSFADAECIRKHSKVRQVWLWQAGQRHYGVGIFSTLVAGRQNLFVRPIVIGEGIKEGKGWRFNWQKDGKNGTALIVLNGGEATLTLDVDLDQGGRELEDVDQLVLKAGGIFSDERIELAPLTTGADWRHWFDNVLVGQFTSGNVPAC
ncbi:MAG: hypothetical protein GY947_20270 [Rhodobacteraceae bacterium]|nr:hypothetical protein [Paracoccaceae bacterium]